MTKKLFNIYTLIKHTFSRTHASLKRIRRLSNLWRHKAFYVSHSSQASTTDFNHSLFG